VDGGFFFVPAERARDTPSPLPGISCLREQFQPAALIGGQVKELQTMADETKTGEIKRSWESEGADLTRINVNEEYELKDWSAKLGVTSWEVKAAVRKVGPRARDVARALGSNARI
jgi:hypothetical protein